MSLIAASIVSCFRISSVRPLKNTIKSQKNLLGIEFFVNCQKIYILHILQNLKKWTNKHFVFTIKFVKDFKNFNAYMFFYKWYEEHLKIGQLNLSMHHFHLKILIMTGPEIIIIILFKIISLILCWFMLFHFYYQ